MSKEQSQPVNQDAQQAGPRRQTGLPVELMGSAGAHLKDDAFAELMMGEEPSVATAAHLESCAACREELLRFQDSVSDFGLASLAWSEARSAELPALGSADVKASGTKLFPALSWALAALLLAGLVVPVRSYLGTRQEFHAGVVGAPAGAMDDDASGPNSPEQIAKDNQLLADVSFELSRSQTSLLAASARQQHSAAAGRHRTATTKRTQ